jgi:phosphatidate cytidylyltransferase
MSYLDTSDSGEEYHQRYRARHGDAAPDSYLSDVFPGYGVAAEPAAPAPVVLPPPSPEPAREEPVREEPVREEPADPEPPPSNGRAGRNLPAAIGVGLTLGGIVVASLFYRREAFLGVIVLALFVATWEMARAVRPSGARPPMVPLLAGGVAMVGLAWYGGAEALTLGLVATAVAAIVWRLADGPDGYQRDVVAAMLIAVYVPFLGGFAVLLDRPDDGALRVIVTLAGVVLSDTGGYVAGVFFGRHAMAPSVSPKKSWEGAVGSLVAAGIGGAILLHYVLHVVWWYGAVFGVAVSIASILGDLAESLIKRDLGIKDMSHLLPGHGGLMDRLDSVLFALPVGYAVLAFVAPTGG